MKYCTKCGKKIEGNSKFCTGCGAKLEEPVIKEAPKKKGASKNIVVAVASVVVLVTVLAVGRSIFSGKGASESSKNETEVVTNSSETDNEVKDNDQEDKVEIKTAKNSEEKSSDKERFNNPDKKKNYDKNASDVSNFEYEVTGDTVCITKYVGEEREVTVPNNIEGKAVNEIGVGAFFEADVDKVVLQKGIEKIADEAFEGCLLHEVVLPKGLKTVGALAFYRTVYLKSVEIPESVTLLGDGCFNSSESLEQVKFNKGKEEVVIGKKAFSECPNLKCDIVIPGNFTVIDDMAFEKDPVTSFTWEKSTIDGKKRLGAEAFKKSSVNAVTIEADITEIEKGCFSNCRNLITAKIPNEIEKIGDLAFSECRNLESINISEGLIYIGDSAFSHCEYISEMVIPSTVNTIGTSAFSNCTGLKSLIIKEGKDEAQMGEIALNNIGVSEIIIPKNYTRVSFPTGTDLTLIKWESDKDLFSHYYLIGKDFNEDVRTSELEVFLPDGVEYEGTTDINHVLDFIDIQFDHITMHIDRDNPLLSGSYNEDDFTFEFYD